MTTTAAPPPAIPGLDRRLDPGHAAATDRPVGRPVRDGLVFLAAVYPVAVALSLAMPGTKANPGPVSMITAFVPALVVGAIRLVARLRHGPANPFPLGLRRLGLRSWPAAIAIPSLAISASFALAWAVGVVRFDGLAGYVAGVPFNIVLLSILFLGEELGWRSYLLPRLASVMSAPKASLVTGFAQACFHLPLLLLTDGYDGDGKRWIVVPGVLVVISSAGALFGWLRLRSGSLWPATIAHAAVNSCLVEAPVLLADDPDLAAHLTGEGGLFTVLLTVAVSIVVLRRATWTPRDEGPTVAATR